jgi:hypothetical protein
MAAAEHSIHMLLAANGGRTNYPRLSHTVLFAKTDDIVRHMQEIGRECNQRNAAKTVNVAVTVDTAAVDVVVN